MMPPGYSLFCYNLHHFVCMAVSHAESRGELNPLDTKLPAFSPFMFDPENVVGSAVWMVLRNCRASRGQIELYCIARRLSNVLTMRWALYSAMLTLFDRR